MSDLSTQPYKGTRDFYPDDMRLQKYIFGVWRKVCESYGYEEYTAPILEPTDLYTAKSGQEIVNEQTYSFKDRGDRDVTIRPEMTPSVSRMVAAKRQELSYPLRWYSVPNLWRYERPQRGRLREHWQLNVDVFGVAGLEAETELIMLSRDIMKAFGAADSLYQIRINSRKLTNLIMHEHLGLDTVQSELLIKLLDKFHKLPRAEFDQAASEIFSADAATSGLDKLRALLTGSDIDSLPQDVANSAEAKLISSLLQRLQDHGISNAVFDVSLMRGFDYYTDVVFEIYDLNAENNRAMFGGGRYDGLVGLFGVEPVPTVGFGMGDVTMHDFLETHQLLPKMLSETEAYIVVIGEQLEAAEKLAKTMRDEGVNVAVDYSGRKMDKQLKTALAKGAPYVVFVGEKDVSEGQYNLKHLPTNTEQRHSPERIISEILDSRTR